MGSFSGEGYAQAAATKKAGKMAYKAAIYAANLQQQQYETTRKDLMPWMETGTWALGELKGKVAAGPGEYEKSPYYNFLLEEGTKGLERGAAARGGLASGAESKELTKYGQNLASTDYDAWLNRWYQSLTPYQSLSQLGQTTGGQVGQLGAQSVANQGNLISQAGQINALSQMGAARSIGQQNQANQNALSQIGQQAISYYTQPNYNTGGPSGLGAGVWNTPSPTYGGFSGSEMNTMSWL